MKILVVTGPSAGHVFPALSFLNTLKDKDKSIETFLIAPKTRYSIKLSLGLKNLLSLIRFFKEALENLFILLKFQPEVVVGFGTLFSIPVILSAWILRIKTLIHEQNVVPGQANKLLAKFSDRIAVSFTESKDYFGVDKKKIVLTGNPLRNELKRCSRNQAMDYFGLSPDKFTILVMGGSAGSHRINVNFLKTISAISNKDNLQVIHLSGPQDYELLKDGYEDLGVNFKLFSFLEPMQYTYSASDLVISRAGAGTISEIMFYQLPAVIIPYPFAYKHQYSNAKVLQNLGAAIVIDDNDLDTPLFSATLADLLNNPGRIKAMRSNYKKITLLNANELLVNEVLSLK